MGRVLAGVLVGVLLAAGSAAWWQRSQPCLDRCGAGTTCVDRRCVVVAAPPRAPAVTASRDRHHRHGGLEGAAPEVTLRPGDERMIAQGDALGRPERIDLTQPDGHERTQEELDGAFQPAEPVISRCITTALGDAPLEHGRVEIGLRVEGGGEVSRVRVEAPQLLQAHGLARCVRAAVGTLKFPAAGGASVVSYPFELK